jgi:hypothetical protein
MIIIYLIELKATQGIKYPPFIDLLGKLINYEVKFIDGNTWVTIRGDRDTLISSIRDYLNKLIRHLISEGLSKDYIENTLNNDIRLIQVSNTLLGSGIFDDQIHNLILLFESAKDKEKGLIHTRFLTALDILRNLL